MWSVSTSKVLAPPLISHQREPWQDSPPLFKYVKKCADSGSVIEESGKTRLSSIIITICCGSLRWVWPYIVSGCGLMVYSLS